MSNLRTDEQIEGAFAPSGSGTQAGFQVQARYMHNEPKKFGDVILDQRWRTLDFPASHVGVPVHRSGWDWWLPASGCMTYEAAQALRWWFLATCVAADVGGRPCLETRIVSFAITYSHSAKPSAVMEEDPDDWRKVPL